MTPTGSRSKAQGCPRCVRETLGRGVRTHPTLKGLRTALLRNPFRVGSFPPSTPGLPAHNAGNPGLCYVTPSALKTVNKPGERASNLFQHPRCVGGGAALTAVAPSTA